MSPPIERLLVDLNDWSVWPWFAWVLFGILREVSVRGSRNRYVFASAERALVPFAWFHVVCYIASGWTVRVPALEESWQKTIAFLVPVFVGYMTYRFWKQAEDDDDDNWFSDTKKRLKRWLRAQRAPQLAWGGAR